MTNKLFLLTLLLTISIFSLGQHFKFKTIDSNYVFDKAKYHLETVQNSKLEDIQAFVHTAFYIDWCINNNLVTAEFLDRFSVLVEKLRIRQIKPSEIYYKMDGVFTGAILTLEGYNFAMQYFDFSKGKYLKDYEKIFETKKRHISIYSIPDSWESYDIISKELDIRYKKWAK